MSRLVVGPLAVLLVLGLAVGCGGGNDESFASTTAAAPFFEDTPWVLAGGVDVAGWEASPPSALFANGVVGGSTGCNRFSAPYTVKGDSLELGQIASTLIGCPAPADAVEKAYVKALGQVASWQQDGAQLVLKDGSGTEVLRYRASTPAGTWEATSIQTPNALASPLSGTKITAVFGEDGSLTGSAGCNTYRTSYKTDRGKITIDPPAATKKFCAEPKGVMEQEAAYLAALPTAVHYRVDGASLGLLRADGTYVASYVRASS